MAAVAVVMGRTARVVEVAEIVHMAGVTGKVVLNDTTERLQR